MWKESYIKKNELEKKANEQQEMYDALLQNSLKDENLLKKQR